MAQMKRNGAQLRRMWSRQAKQAWGVRYQPAIRATSKEAPSISRAIILVCDKLGGRDVHLLSRAEFWVALLALYHPGLFDLHEQHLLSTSPSFHPLAGHPYSIGLALPNLTGTLAVAEQLGALAQHPRIIDRPSKDPNTWVTVPWPYIGDLLLFMLDEAGPYCVNWNVKPVQSAYSQRGGPLRKPRRKDQVDAGAVLRHDIEEKHFQSGAIRTVRATADALNLDVIHNLRELFGWHSRKVAISPGTREAMVQRYKSAIGDTEPAYKWIYRVQAEFGTDRHSAIVVLKQAIWLRTLRVDLFQPLLMDEPLRPETRDVLDAYAHWFAR